MIDKEVIMGQYPKWKMGFDLGKLKAQNTWQRVNDTHLHYVCRICGEHSIACYAGGNGSRKADEKPDLDPSEFWVDLLHIEREHAFEWSLIQNSEVDKVG